MQRAESLRIKYFSFGFTDRPTNEEMWAGDLGMFLAHWFGALYTVVEGWQKLELTDSKIEDMLNSEYAYRLKMFRHGAYHFTDRYWHEEKFVKLLQDKNAIAWAHQLDRELSQYFTRLYAGHRGKSRLLSEMLAYRKAFPQFGLSQLLSCLALCVVLALNTLYRQNVYIATACLLLLILQIAPTAVPCLQNVIACYRFSTKQKLNICRKNDPISAENNNRY